LTAVVETALPAGSVAEAEGVQFMVPVPATAVAAADWVPSVIVTVVPLITIVEAVPVAPKVMLEPV
jgi:hypothetical protein